MKSLTIAFCTSRLRHQLSWFLDSLRTQVKESDNIQILVIDGYTHCEGKVSFIHSDNVFLQSIAPKPTVWSGPQRLTKQEWWSKSNSLNTAIALACGEWFCTMDDRSVILPGWLDSIKQAMEGNYAVFGAYEKRVNMKVENGVIVDSGTAIGVDDREAYCRKNWGGQPNVPCPGEWSYGCNLAMPLEWALEANGFSEVCDGSGAEDTYFGLCLKANGHDTRYNYFQKVIQDRTPSELGTPMRKEDYGVSPNDYSHMLMNIHLPLKRAPHPFDIRDVRDAALRGEPWPEPWGPRVHIWEQKQLEDL